MRQLMISLDKKISNPESRSAKRMVSYGVQYKKDYGDDSKIFILVPDRKKNRLPLSENVEVITSGGFNKLFQALNLLYIGNSIVNNEDIDNISTQDPFFIGFIGLLLKTRKTKFQVQLHGDFYGSKYYNKNFLRKTLGRIVMWRADKIRIVSRRIKQSLKDRGIEPRKMKRNVRPIEPFNTLDRVEKSTILHDRYRAEKIFLWLGRIEPEKNLEFLIDVFAKVVQQKPNYRLLIVGDGKAEDSLRNKANQMQLLQNIIFVPWAQHPAIYLQNADCLVLPSLAEGYSLVVKEATAFNTTVIMNDVGVANYELKPSSKVKILPVNDKQKWIEAILSV